MRYLVPNIRQTAVVEKIQLILSWQYGQRVYNLVKTFFLFESLVSFANEGVLR